MENVIQKHAIAAIIQKEDKFLFVKRSKHEQSAVGYWCPVTGQIEDNETQEEALKREVKEEVGLDIVAGEKICEIPTSTGEFLLHFWTTEIISGEASISSNEASDLRWLTLEELRQLSPVFKEDIRIIEMFVKSNTRR